MTEHDKLAEEFETQRTRLRDVAYRMLGSLSEAEDVVQDAWLRVSRSDSTGVDNLAAWLTTIVARLSLDVLRSRKTRREESLDANVPEPVAPRSSAADPEHEALLADSVGLALLVVLDTLTPGERLAFVLHDMFAMSFDEIATIVGRSPAATRQLASRARRRVQGSPMVPSSDLTRQRAVAGAFLTALRGGDFEGLIAVLDPDLVVRVDKIAATAGTPAEIRGARVWATGAVRFAHGARDARVAFVNGAVGVVIAPRGRLFRVLELTFKDGKIAQIEVIGDPAHLSRMELGILSTNF